MAEITDLSKELFGDEPSVAVAPEPAGPSPGWKVHMDPPPGELPTESSSLGENLFPPEPPKMPTPPEPRRGPLSDLPWFIKTPLAMGTSTVGGWGGAALGGAVGSAVPVVGTSAGGMTGYLAGNAAMRWLNVKLGLEEPGLVGDALSVALPAGTKALGGIAKRVVRNAPGAGVVRHEMAEEMLEGLGSRLKPAMASEDLFTAAAAHNPDIPALSIWQFADELLQQEALLKVKFPDLANDQIARLAQQGKDMVVQYGGQIPLKEFDIFRKRIGLLRGEAQANNWVQESGLKKMYAGFMDDMERAVATGAPGAGILRQGIRAHRTEKALDSLSEIWGPGRGIQAVEGDVTQVMGKKIQQGFERLVKDDDLFRKSFTPAELLDIRRTLEVVAKYAPGGSPLSHGREVGEALRWGARVAVPGGVYATTQNPVMAGVALAAVEATPYVMAMAMTTPTGRWMVRKAMQDNAGILTNEAVAAIAAGTRALLASTEPQQPQPGPFGGPWESLAAPGGPARSTD